MKEQEDDVERAKKHYDLTDEEWSALAPEVQAKLIKTLPPPSDDDVEEYNKAPEEEDWDYDESKYTPEQLSHASAVIVTDDGEVHNPGYMGEDLTKAACKLPHHRPGNGASHGGTLVWRGVSAAGGILMGARGGLDVSEAAKGKARSHLAAHYREFDKVPPWEQEEGESKRPKLKTEQIAGDQTPTVEDRLQWLSEDVSRIWTELYHTKDQIQVQIDAVGKRIDDALIIIAGVKVEGQNPQDPDEKTREDIKEQMGTLTEQKNLVNGELTAAQAKIQKLEGNLKLAEARARMWMNVAERRRVMLKNP